MDQPLPAGDEAKVFGAALDDCVLPAGRLRSKTQGPTPRKLPPLLKVACGHPTCSMSFEPKADSTAAVHASWFGAEAEGPITPLDAPHCSSRLAITAATTAILATTARSRRCPLRAIHLAHFTARPIHPITTIHSTFNAIYAPLTHAFPAITATLDSIISTALATIQSVIAPVNATFHASIAAVNAVLPPVNPTFHSGIAPVGSDAAPISFPAIPPTSALAVPRASAVVGIPVRPHGEADDGHINLRYIFNQGDVTSANRIAEIARVNPTAVIVGAHIAPAVAGHTAVHIHRGAPWHHVNHGESCRGSSSHIEIHRNDCILGRSYSRKSGHSEHARRYRGYIPPHGCFLSTQRWPRN